MNRLFTDRPSEEVALEPMSPQDHQHQLCREALADCKDERPWGAVLHLAQAMRDRAVAENDLIGLGLAKRLIDATGQRGFRP